MRIRTTRPCHDIEKFNGTEFYVDKIRMIGQNFLEGKCLCVIECLEMKSTSFNPVISMLQLRGQLQYRGWLGAAAVSSAYRSPSPVTPKAAPPRWQTESP